jgi:heat shock protein HslJ
MAGQVLPGASEQPPLEGTHWSLAEIYGRTVRNFGGTHPAYIVLHSMNKDFAGSGGCNRLTGSYLKEGRRLHFQVVVSTMMACPGFRMQQEEDMTQALSAAIRYRIDRGILELSDGHRVVARFRAQPAP